MVDKSSIIGMVSVLFCYFLNATKNGAHFKIVPLILVVVPVNIIVNRTLNTLLTISIF
jgi:hypothetical protein